MTARWVTLVLGEDRVVVSREDLISKSDYFAALFSPNFNDYQNSEHRINYDVDINTLRNFIDWLSDHVASVIGDRRYVKPSLAKYVGKSADFDGLLRLLQLSVLFGAETLIQDLTDLVACHWLVPQKCVQIWLFARDLGLVTLRDLAKATCVERLLNVPNSSFLELPGEDFIELVGNVRVQASVLELLNLTQRWVKHNVPPGESNAFESRYPFTLAQSSVTGYSFKQQMYEDQCWKHNIQCIVGHKRTPNDDVRKCIYVWDGTTFSEMVELPSSLTVSTNSIKGMRVVSRGFDIYLVGGEYGEGSRDFQTEIWRYSMISKTWYYVTSLEIPRRNAAITFLREKLFLIGSRDRMQYSNSRVDVYNVHTRQWKVAPYIPVPVSDTSLIRRDLDSICVHTCGATYSYDEDDYTWVSNHGDFIDVKLNENGDVTQDVRVISTQFWMIAENCMYVLGWYKEWEDAEGSSPPKIFVVENYEVFESFYIGECMTYFFNQVANGPYLFGFSHKDDTVTIEMIRIICRQGVESKIVYKEKRSDIKDMCPGDPVNCFNTYNPKSLNELFVFEEKAKSPYPQSL